MAISKANANTDPAQQLAAARARADQSQAKVSLVRAQITAIADNDAGREALVEKIAQRVVDKLQAIIEQQHNKPEHELQFSDILERELAR